MGQFAKEARKIEHERTQCIVARNFAGFDEDDMTAFEHLCRTRQWAVIMQAFPAGEFSLRKHARGVCTCPVGTPVRGVLTDG